MVMRTGEMMRQTASTIPINLHQRSVVPQLGASIRSAPATDILPEAKLTHRDDHGASSPEAVSRKAARAVQVKGLMTVLRMYVLLGKW
jgi:hypothetical protein